MKPVLRNLVVNVEIAPDAVPQDVREWRESLWHGGGAGAVSYGGKGVQGFRVELLFDAVATGGAAADVRPKVKPLQDLMEIPEGRHEPPACLFTWGAYSLPVVARDVRVEYSRFAREGYPTRAIAALVLQIIDTKSALRVVQAPSGGLAVAAGALNAGVQQLAATVDQTRVRVEGGVRDVQQQLRSRAQELHGDLVALAEEAQRQAAEMVTKAEKAKTEVELAIKSELNGLVARLETEIGNCVKTVCEPFKDASKLSDKLADDLKKAGEAVRTVGDLERSVQDRVLEVVVKNLPVHVTGRLKELAKEVDWGAATAGEDLRKALTTCRANEFANTLELLVSKHVKGVGVGDKAAKGLGVHEQAAIEIREIQKRSVVQYLTQVGDQLEKEVGALDVKAVFGSEAPAMNGVPSEITVEGARDALVAIRKKMEEEVSSLRNAVVRRFTANPLAELAANKGIDGVIEGAKHEIVNANTIERLRGQVSAQNAFLSRWAEVCNESGDKLKRSGQTKPIYQEVGDAVVKALQ